MLVDRYLSWKMSPPHHPHHSLSELCIIAKRGPAVTARRYRFRSKHAPDVTRTTSCHTGCPHLPVSSDIWFHVQENIALPTKVCTYDRVGLGFSKRVLQNESTGTEKVWGMSTTGRQVSDLVLIDPIPEVIFEEDQWQKYWYSQLVPSLQAMQFSAATGISHILIILGLLKPAIMGDNIAEDLIQRQYLLGNPAHQSSAVDETFLLNESASQVREISKFKPLSSRTSVSVIIGDSFDEQIPAPLNQVVAQLQKTILEQTYPSANQIHVKGGDRRMIYKRPSVVRKHLWKLVSQRQSKQQSQ